MDGFPERVELLGVCYFPSCTVKKVIPNIVPEGVFYIEIVMAGEVFYDESDRRVLCERGTILWHQGGDETIWRKVDDKKDFISFAVRFRLLEPWHRPGHIGKWNSIEQLDEFVVNTMWNVFDSNIDNRILGNYLFTRLYWEFYSSMATEGKPAFPTPLTKAVTLMQTADIATLSIPVLARNIQISESHLHLLFRKYLNTTPHQYLLALRLKRARVMLSGTNHPVKEICSLCGFSSLETFYRIFRSANGLAPAEYRKRHFALINEDVLRNKVEFNR